ncbi:MAG: carbamoyltransferase HypF [Thermoproteota archaeon]|nr:carbamoyltransferase HypF [Thermoproteota archaeon]
MNQKIFWGAYAELHKVTGLKQPVRAEIRVTGVVQGVGFRPFIYRNAVKNKLVGYVRNMGDAGVEIVVEGKRENVKRFIADLKQKKPPLSQIHDLFVKYLNDKNEFRKFTILKSSMKAELSGSVIPPDIAICDECLRELRNPENERYNYFFITCTNCGPRFTTIERLPYDRGNTTMRAFPMCKFCREEYGDPINRRFHAQTVACSKCGPKVYLTTREGEQIEHDDPIRETGRLLEEGYIVAVKGYGGFHVASATTLSKPIARLRRVKHRSKKPFAIMACSLEAAESFVEVSPKEAELLTSHIRPIVLLRKSENYYLSGLISPGLHNVGVMLPYTGLHVMLFDRVKEPAFVMTSANPPNQPIVKENDEALKRLGNVVDYFLFHNRVIAQRCDDSVIRVHNQHSSLIRRSRGYAPAPIHLKKTTRECVLAVGAELNVTSCILLRDKAFVSQHIGDVENLETLQFLKEATEHLIRLTNSQPKIIACDLHPKFTTTKLAQDLAKQFACPVVPVQHHHAHIAALMVEHNIDEIIGIACDGYGYGSDGEAWGGEILHCHKKGFNRLGHLQKQPLVGGDLATTYPLRMAAGILYKEGNIEEWLFSNSNHLPHGRKETEIILKQLEKQSFIQTTSCGRVLDAVSAILGVCYERTYEGEPAMKLESTATKGKDVFGLKPVLKNNVVETTSMVYEVFKQRNKHSIADLACSTQSYLARSLAELAVQEAERLGIQNIGFSGGVAHNEHITSTIRRAVENNGLQFLVHEQVPPGDGGISFGQAAAAGFWIN